MHHQRARIVGWAHTRFGKLDDPDTEALMAQVSLAALDHAGVDADAVDGILVGALDKCSSMHVVAALQRIDEAGDMQVPGATVAGVFNMGGAAVANYVSLMERVK